MKRQKNGWRKWRGGECPVTPGQDVEVKFRDGTASIPTPAGELDWAHYGEGTDIIRYLEGTHD